jgi:antitoxin ParD1/3/4
MASLAKPWLLCYFIDMGSDDRTTTMNVSLPASLRAFVEAQVVCEGYTSASEYVRELIRKARQKQAAQEHLEELLLVGLESGPATEWTDDDWAGLRRRVAERLEAKKKTG